MPLVVILQFFPDFLCGEAFNNMWLHIYNLVSLLNFSFTLNKLHISSILQLVEISGCALEPLFTFYLFVLCLRRTPLHSRHFLQLNWITNLHIQQSDYHLLRIRHLLSFSPSASHCFPKFHFLSWSINVGFTKITVELDLSRS